MPPNPRFPRTFLEQDAPFRSVGSMTKKELSARAQAAGVSVLEFQARRNRGALGGGLDQDVTPPPEDGGGGGFTLTFAQTEAGQRLAAALALDTERFAGAERLRLEDTIHSLAVDLLPPKDVETAMRQVRRGELVKSKLAFQAVLQNLADAGAIAERRKDIALAEENEKRTLREAKARITVDMVGRDVGRAVLYAFSTGGE